MRNPIKYILLCLLLLIGASRHAAADEPTKEELREQIKRHEEEIRITNELLEKTQKDRKSNEGQLKMVRTQISNRRNMLSSLEKQMVVIGTDINNKNKNISQLTRQIEKLKKDYGNMVYASYKNYKLNNFVLFLFSSDDFNTATRRMDFMKRYNRLRQHKAHQVKIMTDSLQGQIARLDDTRAEMDQTRQTHSKEVASLGKDENQYKKIVSELTSEQKKLQQSVKERQALIAQAQKQIQALIEAEVRRSQASKVSDADLRAIAELSNRFADNKGRLPYPIRGGVIIEGYGEHQRAGGARNMNYGIDVAGTPGAPVNCVFDGEVMSIFSFKGYNSGIIVRHGNYLTVYSNIVRVSVKKGDKVKAGQVIARIDDGQDSDVNALHFEIHKEAVPANGTTERLNPQQWLRR